MDKLLEWCEKGIRYFFYALAYFLPISTGLVELFSTLIIWCYLVIAGESFWRVLVRRPAAAAVSGPPRRTSLSFRSFPFSEKIFFAACGMFFAANVLSTVTSQYPWMSFEALFFKLSQGLILLFAFCLAMRTQKHLKVAAALFLTSATLASMNALYQAWTGHGFVRGFGIVEQARVTSSFKHPNDFGGFLIIASSVVISFILAGIFDLLLRGGRQPAVSGGLPRRPWVWAWLGFLFLIILWSLGLTFSRGAWLGFIVATLCLSLYRRKAFLLLLGVCVLFVVVFHPQLYKVRGRNLRVYDLKGVVMQPKDVKTIMLPEEKQPFPKVSAAASSAETSCGWWSMTFKRVMTVFEVIAGKSMGRFNFWEEAILIIKDYPLFGAGLNTYSKIAPRYKINWGGYPHNCYLHMAAETGIIGLISFLGLVLIFLHWSWSRIAVVKDSFLVSLSLGGLAGLSGFLVQCFFDTNLYSVQLNTLFWLVIGMVMAAIHVGTERHRPE